MSVYTVGSVSAEDVSAHARAPRTGAPSMISNLATVSLSLYMVAPFPVDSLRMIASSMFLIFIRTCTRVRSAARPAARSARRIWGAGGEAHQQEKDLAEYDVLEVVLGLVVLELNVQTVFYPDLHLDRVVCLRALGGHLHEEALLVHDLAGDGLAVDSHA